MNDAPDKIWILRSDAVMAGKYCTVGGLQQVWVGDDGIEYVRADRIEALTARAEAAEKALADVTRDKECFQRMTRSHWEALCAMRDSINEYVPMPSTDSGPLLSPEDGPIYADIAERVIASLKESRAMIEEKTNG